MDFNSGVTSNGVMVDSAYNGLYPVVKNSSGKYTRGSELEFIEDIALNTADTNIDSILQGLRNNERWFVTFFSNLSTPVENNEILPYSTGYTFEENPLASKGVFEIINVAQISLSNDVRMWLNPKPKVNFGAGWGQTIGFFIMES